VPYSDFLSSAETEGGHRRMRARKRKKEKDKAERRRVVCVLVGRDMIGKELRRGMQRALPFLFLFIFKNWPRTRYKLSHVTVTRVTIVTFVVIRIQYHGS
jgi:hypothetical protein